jgi:putative hemolysin
MFMGNFLLKKVPNLADHIIAVNPFENVKDASSISGLKTTLKVLKDGVPVAIFPAGEVSSYCLKRRQITDKEWHPVVGKIIAKANQPILPCISMATMACCSAWYDLYTHRCKPLCFSRSCSTNAGINYM